MTSLTVLKQPLHVPSLDEAAKVLEKGLKSNFAEATCEVSECPNLTNAPWGLASEGIGGDPRIGEIGGVRFLCPLPKKDKVYDLKEVAKQVDLPEAFLIGAGAGPLPFVKKNSEMIPNLKFKDNSCINESRVAKTSPKDDACILEKLSCDETRCSLLMNFYASQGLPGPVIRIQAKKRIGTDDFIGCLRKALEKEYGSKSVGVGGTFRMKKGIAKIHIMPEFSKTPLTSEAEVEKWLKFFDMKAPMVFMSVFVSRDPGLDFRLEHSHGYSDTEGGHYHFDITPDEVEYEGYFNIADFIYRIDKP